MNVRAYYFLCILFMYCNSIVNAQTKLDSLVAVATGTPPDLQRLAAYLKLTDLSPNLDSTTTSSYIQQGKALAEKLSDKNATLYLETNRIGITFKPKQHQEAYDAYLRILSKSKAAKYDNVTSKVLYQIGELHFQLKQYDSALYYYQQSSAIAQQLDKNDQLVATYNQIGLSNMHLGKLEEAISYCKKSLAMYKSAKASSKVAEVYQGLGGIYLKQNEFAAAINYYDSSLVVYQALGNQEGEAHAYDRLGLIYLYQGYYNKAIVCHQKSLKLYKRLGAKKEQAYILKLIGGSFLNQTEYKTAIYYSEQSLNIYKQLNDQAGMAACYNNLGLAYMELHNNAKAKLLFHNCLAISRKLKSDRFISTSLNNIGLVYKSQGQADSALYIFNESLKMQEQMKDIYQMVSTTYNIGLMYDHNRDYHKALDYYHHSIQLSEEIEDVYGMVHTYQSMGKVFLQMGNEDSAFYYIHKGFDICKERNFNKKFRSFFQNIGNWYLSQGNIPKALNFYYDALEIAESMQDTLGLANLNGSLAELYALQKNFEKAKHYEQQQLEYHQLIENPSGVADAKIGLANLLKEEGKYYQEALSYANEALSIYLELDSKCKGQHGLFVIGSIYRQLNEIDSALYYLKKSIGQLESCVTTSVVVEANIELGALYASQNQADLSSQAYEKALAVAQISQNQMHIKAAAEQLYPVYKQRGQFAKAFRTLELYLSSKDSLFNEENTRAIVQKEMEHMLEKERQLQALKQAKQEAALLQQRWIIYGAICAFFTALSIALAIYKNYRNKQKANQLLRVQNLEISNQKKEIAIQNATLQLQTDKLERLNQVKSRFFTNISHELRTPLTLISSPIQSLLHDSEKSLQPNTIQKLEMIDRYAQQLKTLVNDIMDLSKLEVDKLSLQENSVNIGSTLSRICSNFNALAKHLGVQYTCELATLDGVWLLIDALKLEKIINNLVSNALKYTSSKDKIHVQAIRQDHQLLIMVSDTGRGIIKKDLPHIFNRFFQSEQADAPLQGGTGIGLALVKEFTQLMGGKVSVCSEYGKGSVFKVVVPYKEVAPADYPIIEPMIEEEVATISLAHLKPNNILKKRYHVLIVEDHHDMQIYVRDLLDKHYYTHLATNGEEALDVLKHQQIDLIISDVMMPKMDGYALLCQLKETDQFRGIPVIMLTALNDEGHKLQALTIGVDDYLSKPFSPKELLARTHNLLIRKTERLKWIEEGYDKDMMASKVSKPQDVAVVKLMTHDDVVWLKQVEDLLRKDLERQELSVTDLADHCNLSVRQFRRRLKKITGLSPKKYQQELALSQARKYLENESFGNTSAVAYAVGMNHVTKFSKLYEARFGNKPSEYFKKEVYKKAIITS